MPTVQLVATIANGPAIAQNQSCTKVYMETDERVLTFPSSIVLATKIGAMHLEISQPTPYFDRLYVLVLAVQWIVFGSMHFSFHNATVGKFEVATEY